MTIESSIFFLKFFAVVFLLCACFIGVFVFYFGRQYARIRKYPSACYAKNQVPNIDEIFREHKDAVKIMIFYIFAAVCLVEIIIRMEGFPESPQLWRYAHYVSVFCFASNIIFAAMTGAWFWTIHKKIVYFIPATAALVLITGLPMFLGLLS